MMGIKNRSFGPLPPVTLEDLIPPDHFYRHLERTLDLGFVRGWVQELYADRGRPSIEGGLLQTPTDHVLRGHSLGAAIDRDGESPPRPSVVSRLRP
jgi:hypothetical protein